MNAKSVIFGVIAAGVFGAGAACAASYPLRTHVADSIFQACSISDEKCLAEVRSLIALDSRCDSQSASESSGCGCSGGRLEAALGISDAYTAVAGLSIARANTIKDTLGSEASICFGSAFGPGDELQERELRTGSEG